MKKILSKYTYPIYLFRWGILAIPGTWILNKFQWLFPWMGIYEVMIISQIATGAWVYFVDKKIFKSPVFAPLWEIQEEVKCVDCGQIAKGYRLVKTKNYDRTMDKFPEYRCETCSKNKLQKLKERGIEV